MPCSVDHYALSVHVLVVITNRSETVRLASQTNIFVGHFTFHFYLVHLKIAHFKIAGLCWGRKRYNPVVVTTANAYIGQGCPRRTSWSGGTIFPIQSWSTIITLFSLRCLELFPVSYIPRRDCFRNEISLCHKH